MALGLSRERLAWLVGVSSSTIERIEISGRFPRGLEITVEELVAEDVA
jgi:DNA-binding XRE family transcriptional regulator